MTWREQDHPRDEVGRFTFKGTPNEIKRLQQLGFDTQILTNDNDNDIIILETNEYAQFCSVIRTRYTNKIPKAGSVFLANDYYLFRYNRKTEQILCVVKMDIDSNRNVINKLEMWYGR